MSIFWVERCHQKLEINSEIHRDIVGRSPFGTIRAEGLSIVNGEYLHEQRGQLANQS